ncbi:hypothetical protein TraAM80_10060, partial [Trypanosoma rangeli]
RCVALGTSAGTGGAPLKITGTRRVASSRTWICTVGKCFAFPAVEGVEVAEGHRCGAPATLFSCRRKHGRTLLLCRRAPSVWLNALASVRAIAALQGDATKGGAARLDAAIGRGIAPS